MTFISYAQNCEDVLLWRALGTIVHGCYIDVGAADPDEHSVTRAFYEAGWRGVNVEPMADFATRLRLRRPGDCNLSVAAGAEIGERIFYQIWAQPDETSQQRATGLSTLDCILARQASEKGCDVRETRIEVNTLAAICRDHTQGNIHFLKVDAEGSEREVLLGADFTSFRPWIVVVEAIRPGALLPNEAEWEPILLAADYHFVWFDGLNRFYVAAEHFGALAQHFKTPINLFDDFVRHDSRANAALTEARAAFAAEQAETARLHERLDRVVGERDQAIAANGQELARFLQRAAQYEQQLAESEEEVIVLSQTLAVAKAQITALKNTQAATVAYLERLVLELRWDQGPRALRAVLPVARLIRRLNELVGRKPERAEITRAMSPVAAASGSPAAYSGRKSTAGSPLDTTNDPIPGSPTNKWRKRLAQLLYYPLRPIIRPLAWRLRTFLIGDIQRELRQLRDAAPPPPSTAQSSVIDAEAFGEAADRLLLTLALEHRGNSVDPPSLRAARRPPAAP